LRLPEHHPRAAEGACDVFAYAIRHPDGLIVVDTGVGAGNEWIDELYRPSIVTIRAALNEAGLDERDVVAVINTHLHFDHCGQNAAFLGKPVYVQRAELDATADPAFTVSAWAIIPEPDLRAIDGDAIIAEGVRVVATPGHTPGHQSVVLEADDGTAIIVGQCCYTSEEFTNNNILAADMHDSTWIDPGKDSLRTLRDLTPRLAYFSHDATTYFTERTA
jgi:N-acyl homoserine lactone hydrolase